MGTVSYGCGCSITTEQFGERQITGVHHCDKHKHLYSEHKTLYQLAFEMKAVVDHTTMRYS